MNNTSPQHHSDGQDQGSAGSEMTADGTLRAELEELRARLGELEDLEVQRLTEEQERFDSLNVLDEYAQQLEESRDKLARLLQSGVAIEEAKTTHEILQTVANAIGAAGWASAVVYLFNRFEVVEAAYYGVCDEDIAELEKNRRPAEERARMYSPDYDEFKISKSYLVPADRLHEVIPSQYVVPGRREVMPGDDWDPMDLVYVPMYSSTGEILGSINCDDPMNGKRPTAGVFQYLEIFADLAARKIETVKLLNRQAEIEAKLRASEELYRTIFDRSADSILLMDDLFRECNEATFRLFGCERDDIVGHSPVEFSPKFQPDGQRSDKLASEYIARARQGLPQTFDWLHQKLDGTELQCEVSLAPIDVADRPLILAIVRDVSERKRAAHDKETAAIASQLFLSARTPDLVYSQLPKILVSRFGVSAAAIEIHDVSTDEMVLVGEDGTALPLGFRMPASLTFTGTAVRTGEAIVDMQVNRRADFAHANLRRLGLQTIACVPLRVRNQLIGAVWLGDMRVLPNLAQFAMPLQIVANYLAQAIDRYRAEEEMTDMRHFFENLLDNLPAQVSVYDKAGNYRYANKEAAPDAWFAEWIIGRNDEQVAARRGFQPEVGRRRCEAIQQAVAGNQLIQFEETVRDAQDRERYFLRVISPVFDDQGATDHVIGYGLDITDTKLWEQESRLLLKLPTENPFPVLACSPGGEITYMNESASLLAAELGSGDPTALLPTDHATIVADLIEGDSKAVRRSLSCISPHLLWTYVLKNSGLVQLYGVTKNDLDQFWEGGQVERGTDSLSLESELLGHAWLTDLHGNEIWSTKGGASLCKALGVSGARNLLPQDEWTQALAQCAPGRTRSIETLQDGRAFRWHFTQVAPERLLIQLNDQTEIRELQAKLRHAQRLESVGRLAGGIAHDFNNLLTGIIGNLELLESGSASCTDNLECVRDAAHAAERAAGLVKQLLNFSRRAVDLHSAADTNAVCDSVARMLSRTIQRSIHVRTELSPQVWPITGDSSQLEQVLMNLGVNAADAIQERLTGQPTQAGEFEICIRTENVKGKLIRTEGSQPKPSDCVAITVSDNGIGMTPQIRERIFDAYFTTKPKQRGTGLGLAIVAEIVVALGGEIVVESESGRGTTFTIFLPRSMTEAQQVESAVGTLKPTLRGGQETILLVDDEPVIIELGTEVLEQFGYRVISASDGIEALERFGNGDVAFDLVIMDVCLPRLSGEEAIAQILEQEPDLPVILSSGLPESASHYRNINLGSVAFIQKPYRPSELLSTVREVLDHAKK